MPMHPDEVDIDEEIARRLIRSQFSEWADEPIERVAPGGTVNAIFRIGQHFAARFPLRGDSSAEATRAELMKEAAAMRALAACCPVPVPLPVAIGSPDENYSRAWAVQTWVAGDVATPHLLEESETFAQDLTTLIRALRSADTNGRRFSGSGRGGDLADSDGWMTVCLRESRGLLPVERLASLWHRFRTLPVAGPDVMSHGDLIPANLLVKGERLAGVLDGGGFGPADPALDLVAAWHLLGSAARALVRRELGASNLEWQRGAAWAFPQAMGLTWCYRHSNPAMSEIGRATLSRILEASYPANHASIVH